MFAIGCVGNLKPVACKLSSFDSADHPVFVEPPSCEHALGRPIELVAKNSTVRFAPAIPSTLIALLVMLCCITDRTVVW